MRWVATILACLVVAGCATANPTPAPTPPGPQAAPTPQPVAQPVSSDPGVRILRQAPLGSLTVETVPTPRGSRVVGGGMVPPPPPPPPLSAERNTPARSPYTYDTYAPAPPERLPANPDSDDLGLPPSGALPTAPTSR